LRQSNYLAAPHFPTDTGLELSIPKEGACYITLNFMLLKNGTIEDITVQSFENRCKPLVRSSIIALKKSEFKELIQEKQCHHTFIYMIK